MESLAAADHQGHLWISLSAPYTYVYDGRGEKLRTIEFHAAGVVSPASLFFTTDDRLVTSPGGFIFDGRIP